MEIPDHITQSITGASAKALATYGPAGLNVVPVSVVTIEDGRIWLYNFFMDKTIQNITSENTPVALTCWDGLVGIQIRAHATYITEGAQYDTAVIQMQEQFPDRILAGILVVTPDEYYDISANAEQAGKRLCT